MYLIYFNGWSNTKKIKQNKSEQVERYLLTVRSLCTTDYRFESCYSLDDKRSVMERLDNPLSEAELKEQELLENVQSKWITDNGDTHVGIF